MPYRSGFERVFPKRRHGVGLKGTKAASWPLLRGDSKLASWPPLRGDRKLASWPLLRGDGKPASEAFQEETR